RPAELRQWIQAGPLCAGDRAGHADADLCLARLSGDAAQRRRGAPPMTATLRRFLAVNAGGAALELALTFPVFILIVVGIFSVAFLLWTENSIQFAADAAARCA